MSKKYNEIMEKIEVTDELRARVLANIKKEAAAPAPAPVVRLSSFRRYLSVAACLAAVLVCVLVAPALLNKTHEEPFVQSAPDIVSYQSAQALSEAMGFPVEGLSALPFSVADTSFCAYAGELAEITYTGNGDQSAVYRKSAGTEDNSGNYETFDVIKQLSVNGKSVSLNGSAGGYSLAWWTDGEYVCSVCLSFELSESAWQKLLTGA